MKHNQAKINTLNRARSISQVLQTPIAKFIEKNGAHNTTKIANIVPNTFTALCSVFTEFIWFFLMFSSRLANKIPAALIAPLYVFINDWNFGCAGLLSVDEEPVLEFDWLLDWHIACNCWWWNYLLIRMWTEWRVVADTEESHD